MNKWIEILLGLVFLLVAVFFFITNLYSFGQDAIAFLKGGIIWLLVFLGIIMVLVGISDLKN